jgi:hypothetical protein
MLRLGERKVNEGFCLKKRFFSCWGKRDNQEGIMESGTSHLGEFGKEYNTRKGTCLFTFSL